MEKIDAILDAAFQLFSDQGFEHTPLTDVANRARVAAGTIIYHFKTKENLLFIVIWSILNKQYKAAYRAVTSVPPGLPSVRAFIVSFFEFLRAHRKEYKILLKSLPDMQTQVVSFPQADLGLIHARHVRLLEEALEFGIASGEIRKLNPADTAAVIMATLMGAARLHLLFDLRLEALQTEILEFARLRLDGHGVRPDNTAVAGAS